MPLPQPTPESTALITGASAGLGADLARALAARGWGVTLVARREKKLAELAAELVEAHGVRAEALAVDLADPDARKQLVADVGGLGLTVEVLVNNAGYGSGGRFTELDLESETNMIRLNCEAVVDLCGRYAPPMAERGRGGILNVASIISFQPVPRQATYSGSKAMVRAFSEALHTELAPSGVHVTALCPGPMKTEFIEVADMGDVVAGSPDFVFKPVPEVAEAGVEGLERNRRVVLPSALDRLSAAAGTYTPHAALLPLYDRFYPVGK